MRIVFLVSCILFSVCLSATAQSCANYNFASSNQDFSSCSDLPYLNSHLHWKYSPSAETVQIAFRCTGVSSSRWVAWAINPTSHGMVGSQALVAYRKSDGTMRAYTSPVTSYQTGLQEGDLSFPVSDLTATYSNNEIIIFATLKLQNISSSVNQVWQEGPVSNDSPGMHPVSGANVQSVGTLNLLSGESGTTPGAGAMDTKIKKKNTHGILNAVSWGIMMPIGALIARYLKVFPSADPAWFYLHVTCQFSGYVIGVAGWATGLQLGGQSPGIQHTAHRTIGILLFCLATVQAFAVLLRPKKDHKYRFYWNIYHHSFGYAILVLSIVNIFKGFNILSPEKKWERAYIGILVGLACAAVILEVYTWFVVVKRKKTAAHAQKANGTNGYSGYGAGPQDTV